MGELVADLKRSLMTPDEDFVKVVNSDEEGSTKMISDRDMARIKKQSKHRDSMEEAIHLRTEADVKRSAKKRYVVEEEDEEEEEIEEEYYEDDEEEEEDYNPKAERLTTALAVIAAILIGCIVLFLVGSAVGLFEIDLFGKGEDQNQEQTQEVKEQVEMIEVVGKNIDDVKVALLNLGLTPEIEYQESTQYEQGTVMSASVEAGTKVSIRASTFSE